MRAKGLSPVGKRLMAIYRALRDHAGHREWWPGETDFEMILGAILTQNTSWTNVERALANLRQADLLSCEALRRCSDERLSELLRPSGYFNIKTKRIRGFLDALAADFDGDLARILFKCDQRKHEAGGRPMCDAHLDRLFALEVPEMRRWLLGTYGIGKETADCIILYGARKPIFVIDAYTRRAFGRIGLSAPDASYDTLQEMFTQHLPQDLDLYNDYHAQIVYLGKDFCRPRKPRCGECPAQPHCDHGRQGAAP